MYRAMIVDDEPFMLEGMRLMIDWAGCGFELCGEAGSAQEALRLVDTLRPHLLITDVRMPGMLGTDLAAIVSHYHPEVILLFFSVFKDFSYAQSAIRAHAFGYLVKPIDTQEVHETLRRVKQELDARAAQESALDGQAVMLRDQVLRRIALGDDSPESLMRAAVLLDLKRGDPCYCAVLERAHGPVPESVKMLLTTCGGVPFHLAPNQYGLGFRQIERDLLLLERLQVGLSDTGDYALSVGRVHRSAEGFAQSLREALDAQGVLFERSHSLRLYHPFDASAAAWLEAVRPANLVQAMQSADPAALDKALTTVREAARRLAPSVFALRYMAATLDSELPAAHLPVPEAAAHPLWQEEAQDPDAWLDAFCAQLTSQRAQAAEAASSDPWPAPVQATLEAVRTRYPEALSMAGIAEELSMNPAYLGQLVRRYTGATFHHKLLDTRVEQACVLLRQTVRPVGDIAQEVGFRDVDYFSQQFRRRVGMSPIAFRGAEGIGGGRYAPD